jgi:hypothetical protein
MRIGASVAMCVPAPMQTADGTGPQRLALREHLLTTLQELHA